VKRFGMVAPLWKAELVRTNAAASAEITTGIRRDAGLRI
jgi:hypothetical protein